MACAVYTSSANIIRPSSESHSGGTCRWNRSSIETSQENYVGLMSDFDTCSIARSDKCDQDEIDIIVGIESGQIASSEPVTMNAFPSPAPHAPSVAKRALGARSVNDGSTIIVFGSQEPTATVILMHGLGDTARGWKDSVMRMSRILPHLKWVLPTAPTAPVTINGGVQMPSWYDIETLSESRHAQNCKGLEESQEAIMRLISKENINGIPTSRVVLAGFSQGGALSLWVGLQLPSDRSHPKRLAGVAVLSGYLPKHHTFVLSEHGDETPVFHAHGLSDSVVHPSFAEESRRKVLESGHRAGYDLRKYAEFDHSVSSQELNDVVQWLARILPKV